MRTIWRFTSVIMSVLPIPIMAQVPQTLSYQGILADTSGNPKPDGLYSFTFQLYDASEGGSAKWSETKELLVEKGLISTLLGDLVPFSPSLAFDKPYWLGITPGNDPEVVPRIPLSSVGYSFRAMRSDTAEFAHHTAPLTSVDSARIAGTFALPFNRTVAVPGIAFQLENTAGGGVSIYSSSGAALSAEVLASTGGVGISGLSEGENGTGVLGHAYALTGFSYGVMGLSESSSGYGGFFDAFGTGASFGVHGRSFSPTGTGVKGIAQSATGINYGVYGETNSPSGYAGYFAGAVRVNGTLYKNAGSFRIDHPLDPANKYLSHSFVESPDMMNIYNGNVVLGADGDAWIELPAWFDALNKEFRYQLTCVGRFAPVYVGSEIANNRFRIAGGSEGLKVSWQVTGIRKDAYAERHRIVVEEEKPASEKGVSLKSR